jgi:hypothetical protein
MLKEHCVLYMLEILDEKQKFVFYSCLRSVILEYIKKICDKSDKVSWLSNLCLVLNSNCLVDGN